MKYKIVFFILNFYLFSCDRKSNDENNKSFIGERNFIEVTQEQKQNFKKSVQQFEKITKQNNFKKIVEYSHPLVIKRLVDLNNIDEKTAKDALAEEMGKTLQELRNSGIIFQKREITKFSDTFVKYNETIYTSYQTSTTLIIHGKTASILETVIAVSKDNGKWWYFIDKNGNATGEHILLQEIDKETFNVL